MARSKLDGFVTAHGGAIVDTDGRPIQLRGVGLGNWLLPEGYMWRLSPGRESPRQIEALITELVGQDRSDQFWRSFRDRYVTEADIAQIAAEGFNHVRLPINWRYLMNPDASLRSDGLALVDRLIEWCSDHAVWVLLDLHAAPGGQTGTNIDDSNGRPELFMDRSNRDLTIAFWQAIAARYAHDTTVLGYDLLNEPLSRSWQHQYPNELVDLYLRITAAIREVDRNHLIMYEGTGWATNWDIFTEVWDSNSALQFHRYWLPPDLRSIQTYIDIGARLGLPIYMGEAGENNTDWLATAFQLFEDHDIGWNFWPWKKLDTRTSPCSIKPPTGWSDIAAYGNGNAPPPSPDHAWHILSELTDNLTFDRCRYHPDIINALFRRAPIALPSTGFGFRGPGISYSTRSGSPLPGFRPDDQVTILHSGQTTDNAPFFEHNDGRPRRANERLTVLLQPQEWITYSVEMPQPGSFTITAVTVPPTTAPPGITLDHTPLAVDHLGSGQWRALTPPDTPAGSHTLRIEAAAGALHLDRLDVQAISKELPPIHSDPAGAGTPT
ncbi:MAG: cellulase family glycosylhydrolase [Acidimicrobiia bacterium]|nr:cellulase family glycosylhydrolase [Acidimicrobiia bacterium]